MYRNRHRLAVRVLARLRRNELYHPAFEVDRVPGEAAAVAEAKPGVEAEGEEPLPLPARLGRRLHQPPDFVKRQLAAAMAVVGVKPHPFPRVVDKPRLCRENMEYLPQHADAGVVS